MKKLWPLIIGLVVVVIAIGLVLGKSKRTTNDATSATESTTGSSASKSQAVSTSTVNIKDFAFNPSDVTVKKGTTVTWTNQDGTAHTITADDDAGPDSGPLASGKSYSFTFNTAGTFTYHCNFHSDMTGTVVVTE